MIDSVVGLVEEHVDSDGSRFSESILERWRSAIASQDSLYEYQGLSGYGMAPKEMQWCDDRNESRTASCQHQRVSPCAGLPGRAAMLGERNFSSSSGSLCEQKRGLRA